MWLKVTIFSLGAVLHYSDFKQFIIKMAMAHHPAMQKEVNELLAKGAIETLAGDTN